jgi:integrase
MHRMGHSTVRAAMIYQHATDQRDRQVAAEKASARVR